MKIIKLKTGEEIIVDDDVYEWASKIKWYNNCGYATNKAVKLHQLIIQKVKGFEIDHKNRNKLDNRLENLRIATKTQNHANSEKRIGATGFRGVRIKKNRKNYEAQIQKDNKKIYIGVFKTKEEAARAYNKKAIELFGEFAYLNKV